MSKPDAEAPFAVTVHMTDGRSASRPAHTVKAARHFARSKAGNPAVARITLEGPGGSSELYARA